MRATALDSILGAPSRGSPLCWSRARQQAVSTDRSISLEQPGNDARRSNPRFVKRFAFAMSVALLTACEKPAVPQAQTFQGETMGTTYNVSIVSAKPLDDARVRSVIDAELDSVDRAMSTYRDDSELSLFNRHSSGEPFALSAETFAVFAAARAVSVASGGAFDITVGPLVEAWGFGRTKPTVIPTSDMVESLKERTGWIKVLFDSGSHSVRKAVPQIECDLSAIAKGYAVDRVSEALSQLGQNSHMVEVGGEVRVRGLNAEGKRWRIGIEAPGHAGGVAHRILPLSDIALATSGDYRNFREIDGRRYSHTIDPRTGRPVEHRTASVTVLAKTAMRADAYATAILVLGETSGLELAEREGLAVLMLLRGDDGGFDELASTAFDETMRSGQP